MSQLFTPIRVRDLEIRNRVWVSPMCQYSSVDGMPDDWHLVHLGSFARGGAGLVFTEASAVLPEGRISPVDAGIWNDEQATAWARVVDFVHARGATAGIQLAHAGRKASTTPPFEGRGPVADQDGGWRPVAPSADPFPGLRQDPAALDAAGIAEVVDAFAAAARRALAAGFDVLELHAAHGYLLHEFYSPLSNHRDDEYGGSFAGPDPAAPRGRRRGARRRTRRHAGGHSHLRNRLGRRGLELDDSVRLAGLLEEHGVDLVDVSSGGNADRADPRRPRLPGRLRPTGPAGGRASRPGRSGWSPRQQQAEEVIASGAADVVLLARALLRNPHWALRAAHELGVTVGEGVEWPKQYLRATLD